MIDLYLVANHFFFDREIIFSIDNLCMDTFIRFYMDEAGYVPIALLCNYANVAMYGAPYTGIIDALVRNSERTNLEVDLENETIRLKTGWEVVSYNLSIVGISVISSYLALYLSLLLFFAKIFIFYTS